MNPNAKLYLANVRIAERHRDAAAHRLVATGRQPAPSRPGLRWMIRAATAAAAAVTAHAR